MHHLGSRLEESKGNECGWLHRLGCLINDESVVAGCTCIKAKDEAYRLHVPLQDIGGAAWLGSELGSPLAAHRVEARFKS